MGKIIGARILVLPSKDLTGRKALADSLKEGYEIETVAVQYIVVKREPDEEEFSWKS